jgi:hypothetical protein
VVDADTAAWLAPRVRSEGSGIYRIGFTPAWRLPVVASSAAASILMCLAVGSILAGPQLALLGVIAGFVAVLAILPLLVVVLRIWWLGAAGPIGVSVAGIEVPVGSIRRRALPWELVQAVEGDATAVRLVLKDGSVLRVRDEAPSPAVRDGLIGVLEHVGTTRSTAFMAAFTQTMGLERWTRPTHDGVTIDLSPAFKPVPLWLPILFGLAVGGLAMMQPAWIQLASAFGLLAAWRAMATFHPDGPDRGARSIQLDIDAVRLQVRVGLAFGRSRSFTVPVSSITDVRGAASAIAIDTTDGPVRIPVHGRSVATISATCERIREALASGQSPAGRDAVPDHLARLARSGRSSE